MSAAPALSRRCYERQTEASSWEEIWEAGPYYDRISELLETARRYVVLVGWQVDSRLPLRRPLDPLGNHRPHESLKRKILRLCSEKSELHVYFLMWDHASLYIVEREWWQTRLWEEIHPRVHFVFDNRHPFGGSHHEKICVIDGNVAFCGGIDLCDDRWDSPEHLYHDPRRSLDWRAEHHGPYHDMAVQLTGPICQDILVHVARRWNSLSGIPFPEAHSSAMDHLGAERGHRVYLSRTLVNEGEGAREPIIREIEFLFRELVQKAERQILVEGQYYWSRELNDVLIAKIRRMKNQDFRIILILSELKKSKSFTKNMARHELRLLSQLQAAAEESHVTLEMGAPYVMSDETEPSEPLRPIYVHSKIVIIDDRFLSIGSANLATRALRIDTELGVTLEATTPAERSHIRRVTRSILHHWGMESASGFRGGVFLRPIKPAIELAHMREFRWSAPWRPFFDPSIPWFRPIKRRVRGILGAPRSLRKELLQWSVSWLATLIALHFAVPDSIEGARFAFPALLCTVGVLPIPFFLITGAAAALMSGPNAFITAVLSLWSAALFRYGLERAFPSERARLDAKPQSRIDRRLGRRSLRLVLLAAADPRDGAYQKIAALGRYCIPFPWFLACMAVIFPALLAATILLVRLAIAWGAKS